MTRKEQKMEKVLKSASALEAHISILRNMVDSSDEEVDEKFQWALYYANMVYHHMQGVASKCGMYEVLNRC